jgi:hypothetical protein
VSRALSSDIHAWLAREQAAAMNVFVSVNALRRTATRRRTDVSAVRHVFLDADRQASTVLAAVTARPDVPPPSYVLRSSPNRVHIFWRVAGFTVQGAEAVQKRLARELGTDTAATSAAQMTRLVGAWNWKYAPATLVTIEYRDVDRVYRPDDFPRVSHAKRPGSRRRASTTRNVATVLTRARRYVAACPPAITGSHGDVHTFRLCCRLVRGFALSDLDALSVLRHWNARCEPPWSERDLVAKLRHARRYGREPIGALLERQAETAV